MHAQGRGTESAVRARAAPVRGRGRRAPAGLLPGRAPLRVQRERRTQDVQAVAAALRRHNQVVGVPAVLPRLRPARASLLGRG